MTRRDLRTAEREWRANPTPVPRRPKPAPKPWWWRLLNLIGF